LFCVRITTAIIKIQITTSPPRQGSAAIFRSSFIIERTIIFPILHLETVKEEHFYKSPTMPVKMGFLT
jgi:hypothetical protein